MMRRSLAPLLASALALVLAVSACKHEAPAPLDLDLLHMAQNGADRTWYEHSSELRPRSPGSGHSEAFLRTWYNSIAAQELDTSGRVVPGSVFQEGALIVKELYGSSSDLERYAILYKQHDRAGADANGWVWCEVRPSGAVTTPSGEQGSGCRSCHGGDGNIDFTLMDEAFP